MNEEFDRFFGTNESGEQAKGQPQRVESNLQSSADTGSHALEPEESKSPRMKAAQSSAFTTPVKTSGMKGDPNALSISNLQMAVRMTLLNSVTREKIHPVADPTDSE